MYTQDSETALFWAAYRGYVDIVQALIDYGATVDLGRDKVVTIILNLNTLSHYYSIYVNYIQIAPYYSLAKGPTIVAHPLTVHYYYATQYHSDFECQVLEIYLKFNLSESMYGDYSNYYLSTIQHGSTSLMEASDEGHLDTVRVLLEAKADPNITNEVNFKLPMHSQYKLIIYVL